MSQLQTIKVNNLKLDTELISATDLSAYLNSQAFAGIDTSKMVVGDYIHYNKAKNEFVAFNLMNNDLYICESDDEVDLCKAAEMKYPIVVLNRDGLVIQKLIYDDDTGDWLDVTLEDASTGLAIGQQSYNRISHRLSFQVSETQVKTIRLNNQLEEINDYLDSIGIV